MGGGHFRLWWKVKKFCGVSGNHSVCGNAQLDSSHYIFMHFGRGIILRYSC